MLKKKIKNKFIFLFKNLKKKKNFINSIIQNNEIQNIKRQFIFLKIKNQKILKKNCLFGISEKYIEKKSKLSRFAIKNITKDSLNQNFIKKN